MTGTGTGPVRSGKKKQHKKAAEALAQANDVGRHNFGALETRLMALQEKVDAHDAFYKRKLEKQESYHQDVMALADDRLNLCLSADERLRQLEQHGSSSNMVRQQLEQFLRDHQGLL